MNSPYDQQPGSTPKKSNRTWIIVLIVLLVLCCLCSLLAAGGGATYYYLKGGSAGVEVLPETAPGLPPGPGGSQPGPAPQPGKISITPFPGAPEFTAIPPSASGSSSRTPGGMTLAEVEAYFNGDNAFKFDAPVTADGVEKVVGKHQSLCVQGTCALLTLLSSTDHQLMSVAMLVPLDPAAPARYAQSLNLIKDLAGYFAGSETAFPAAVLADISGAQAQQKSFNKSVTKNGYTFFESYSADTPGVAGGFQTPVRKLGKSYLLTVVRKYQDKGCQ